jgi:hypothetical protein
MRRTTASNAPTTTVSFAIALDEPPTVTDGQVSVSITLASSAEDVLTVPASALRTSDDTNYWVEVIGKDNKPDQVT